MERSGHGSKWPVPRKHERSARDISFACPYLNLNLSAGFVCAPSTAKAWLGQARRSDNHSGESSGTCPQPGSEEEQRPPLLFWSSHSPVEHLEDNSYLVIYPEHPNLAEAAEESSEGCFMSWGRKKPAKVDSLPEKGARLFLASPESNLLRTAPLWRKVNMEIMGPLPLPERPRPF